MTTWNFGWRMVQSATTQAQRGGTHLKFSISTAEEGSDTKLMNISRSFLENDDGC